MIKRIIIEFATPDDEGRKTANYESEKEDHSDESIESIHDEINAMLKLINTLRKRGNDNE